MKLLHGGSIRQNHISRVKYIDIQTRIRKLARDSVIRAEEETYFYPRGSGKLKFNDNTSPFGPSPAVRKIMDSRVVDIIGGDAESGYYPDQNASELRKLIAANENVAEECVVVGAGADEIIDMIFRVFVNPGDVVCIPTPSYFIYDHFALISSAKAVHQRLGKPPVIPFPADAGSKLYVISNPNNPVGTLFPVERILELLASFRGIMVVDEAYSEYAGVTLVPHIQNFPNLVVVRTFSKIYGLTNFRIGYSISVPEIAGQMRKVKNPFNVSTVSQKLAAEAVKDQPYVKKIRELVGRERTRVRERLRALGIATFDSDANFVLAEVGPGRDMIADALESDGVYFKRISDPDYGNCLRLTIRSPDENTEMLSRFERVLSRFA